MIAGHEFAHPIKVCEFCSATSHLFSIDFVDCCLQQSWSTRASNLSMLVCVLYRAWSALFQAVILHADVVYCEDFHSDALKPLA